MALTIKDATNRNPSNVIVRLWPVPMWLLMAFGPSGCSAFDGDRNSYLFTWLDILDKYLHHLSVGW